MQKVYLLLRGNQQQGPYSLQEIIQFNLKPADLIWIEGKSAGWYYPQEISELAPYVDTTTSTLPNISPKSIPIQASATTPAVQPQKIFVSMPTKISNEPSFTEPTSTNLFSHAPDKSTTRSSSPQNETPTTTVKKTLDDVETDYTNWVYTTKEKKQKQKNKRRLALVSFIAAALVGFAAFYFLSQEKQDITEVGSTAPLAVSNEILADKNINDANEQAPTALPMASVSKKQMNKLKLPVHIKPSSTGRHTSSVAEKYNQEPEVKNEEEEKNTKSIIENPGTINTDQNPVNTEVPVEKKKKLKEKIIDLFKKEAKPVEVEDGERRSVHRESDADLSKQIRISFTIPNNWMMGIKGGKVSLLNSSNQTIIKATINVLYYNEDNDLLQTKTIAFSKIETKETQTTSIPDHSFADHVEYKIIAIQGSTEPYAKQ